MERKEAIEIIKKNWPDGRHQLSKALECLIPELAESEDEKTRKEIISHFIELCGDKGDHTQDKMYERFISYLERQKPIEWSEEDKKRIENLIAVLENKGYPDYVKWLESLNTLIRWKPSDKQMTAFCVCMTEAERHLTFKDDACVKSLFHDLEKLFWL